MNEKMTAEVECPGLIPNALGGLEKRVANLHESLNMLGNRLTSVRDMGKATPLDEVRQNTESACEVYQRLSNINGKVNDAIDFVETLLNDLEI